MSDRQDALLPGFDPTLLRKRLAFRAVPIATRVVGGTGVAATITDIEMATQRSSPTRGHGCERTTLFWSSHGMRRESMTMTAGDIADVVLWSMGAPDMGRRHGYTAGSASSRLAA
jgi:hypothetical protein